MTNELTVKDQIKTALVTHSDELQATLPAHIKPEKFINTALLAWSQSSYVQNACKTPEGRKTFFTSVMRCAQDGLLPDGKEAAFVAYKNNVQYMPMVDGLKKAMYNSGEIKDITTRVVFANDIFNVIVEDGREKLTHYPTDLKDDPGEAVGVYCVVNLKNGGQVIEVMRKAEVEKIRSFSKSASGPAWRDWWTEMAKAKVLRRAYKSSPKSADTTQMDRLIESDNDHYDLEKHKTERREKGNALFFGGDRKEDHEQIEADVTVSVEPQNNTPNE